MKHMTAIATCLVAVCLLAPAPAASAAAADALSAGTLRTDQDASYAASTREEARRAEIEIADDAQLTWSEVEDGATYYIKVAGNINTWEPYDYDYGDRLFMAADGSAAGDKRDSASSYVYGDTTRTSASKFVAIASPDTWAFFFKHKTSGRYLAAHDYYKSDRLSPSAVRLIVHSDKKKAATFEVTALTGHAAIVTLRTNLDHTAGWTENMKVGRRKDSAKRDGNSEYLAVVDDYENADLLDFEEV